MGTEGLSREACPDRAPRTDQTGGGGCEAAVARPRGGAGAGWAGPTWPGKGAVGTGAL